jgi:hypothetical protein
MKRVVGAIHKLPLPHVLDVYILSLLPKFYNSRSLHLELISFFDVERWRSLPEVIDSVSLVSIQ